MSLRGSVLWVTIVIVSVGCPALADDPPVRYDGYKVVRVFPGTWEQIDQLHGLGARLMSEAEGLGPVDYLLPPGSLAGLDLLGIPYKVLNENIQHDIDAERARLAAEPLRDPNDPAWFDDYKTYVQVNAKLNKMAADRPDLASVFDVGSYSVPPLVSLEGRHIYGIRITGPGTNKPAVQFNGCHHAREWISVSVPMWIADKLVYDYDTNPTIHSLVDRVEFFIIPIVNVDGYVYSWLPGGRLWRKNRRLNAGGCYGVDDNRNYSVGWGGGGSSGNPCDETYRGTAAFSEPETLAMSNFAITHPQIVSTQSYHSYSQLYMSPYGYTSALPADNATFMELDQGAHDQILAVHSMQYDYGPIYTTIYQASGGDVDWYYDHEGIFSFTTELRDTGEQGFVLDPNQIIPTSEENFAAALYLAEWSSSPVKISFPNGLPTRLTPNTPENVQVKIIVVGATLDTSSPRLYTRIGSTGSYTEYTLTPLGGSLYRATLPATPCGATLSYYFSAATTTGIVGLSPADAPTTVYQATSAPIVAVLNANMDTNPGWTVQPLWAWGHPTGQGGEYGGPDPNSGRTGTNVYGYNLNGDYENGLSEKHLTTTAINCSGATGVKLSFYRWLGVEQPTYDHAYVRVSNNGTTWTNIWQNTGTIYDGAWVYQEFDISVYADNKPTVYIRWTMGTTDGGWRYCGWNIDDVQIWAVDPAGCPRAPGDLNCDGVINFADINPFVLALGGEASYYAEYPTCNWHNADCNNDGEVNFADINAFVALLGS